MKVVKSEDNSLRFNNGLEIAGLPERDCCEVNYLDFEGFPVGTELPTMTGAELARAVKLKKDGFALRDTEGTPRWVQARSINNGYYGTITAVVVSYKGKTLELGSLEGEGEK